MYIHRARGDSGLKLVSARAANRVISEAPVDNRFSPRRRARFPHFFFFLFLHYCYSATHLFFLLQLLFLFPHHPPPPCASSLSLSKPRVWSSVSSSQPEWALSVNNYVKLLAHWLYNIAGLYIYTVCDT